MVIVITLLMIAVQDIAFKKIFISKEVRCYLDPYYDMRLAALSKERFCKIRSHKRMNFTKFPWYSLLSSLNSGLWGTFDAKMTQCMGIVRCYCQARTKFKMWLEFLWQSCVKISVLAPCMALAPQEEIQIQGAFENRLAPFVCMHFWRSPKNIMAELFTAHAINLNGVM